MMCFKSTVWGDSIEYSFIHEPEKGLHKFILRHKYIYKFSDFTKLCHALLRKSLICCCLLAEK